ncbi:hypothetical protein CTI12_AA502630 [Artemisia annua]|uniref:DUF4216 domain-containing protein n=1 Tax=Artemisia annua TaxID=35608 RepID=A0A2U1LDC8_ARTAN|nr:hypothetical protein CTI12_AA502630 [Artemisia annua]
MQEEFPDWFGSQIRQRHVDNDQDPEVSETSELFALANGPSWTPISVNSCVVNGVRYVVHSRDERRTTQNSGICSPGRDGEMYYGQLQEILEFKYLLFKVALFRVKWFDTSNKGHKVKKLVFRNNMTQIVDCSREAFKDDQYILVTQVKQVFYLEDTTKPHRKVVEHVNHKKFSDGGVIVTMFNLRKHMESSRWTEIYEGINNHLQKAYNTNKASFKAKHWKTDPTTGTYDVEAIRRARPEEITAAEWDKYIQFWNDPRNLARAAQNRLNRKKSLVVSRQGSRSMARLRHEMASFKAKHWKADPTTGTYDVEAIRRARPEEITAAEWDKYIQFWNDPKNLARAAQNRLNRQKSLVISRQGSRSLARLRHEMAKYARPRQVSMQRKIDFMMSLFRSDDKYSDMFKEFESGGASGSGGCGDDEESGDAEDGEDEDVDDERLIRILDDLALLSFGFVGPTSSPGIIAGDTIPVEASPANIPQRQDTGETNPQRHVAWERPELSMGKGVNVVVVSEFTRSVVTDIEWAYCFWSELTDDLHSTSIVTSLNM